MADTTLDWIMQQFGPHSLCFHVVLQMIIKPNMHQASIRIQSTLCLGNRAVGGGGGCDTVHQMVGFIPGCLTTLIPVCIYLHHPNKTQPAGWGPVLLLKWKTNSLKEEVTVTEK